MTANDLSASEAARRIAAGTLTSEELVRSCLERIAARESTVRAWASLRGEAALAEARQKDRQAPQGPLHGVPVGIKDVIDTADLPTEMGSPIYQGNRPRADAACVAAIKEAGGIVLGKTVTAEFAYVAPGPTTNPHNPRHTPGGSSSGSAAAVADGMIPLALGTQTGGSVIRPASFCGTFGYKPTYGTVSRAGLKLAAESLDTVGFLARDVEDFALLKSVLAAGAATPTKRMAVAAPTIGLCRTHQWDQALPAAQEAVIHAAEALSRAGAQIVSFDLPAPCVEVAGDRTLINSVERAHSGMWEWTMHRDRLSKSFQDCLALGLAANPTGYQRALGLAGRARLALDAAFAGIDALLTLSASGEAPEGLGHTGDSTFQSLWTMLHVPTVTAPSHHGPGGLPIGVQFVGPRYGDDRLLAIVAWAWQSLAALEPPR